MSTQVQVIRDAIDDFVEAMQNFDLSEEATQRLEQSVLDCAIYMSFLVLELALYIVIIEGSEPRTSPETIKNIIEGKWKQYVNKDYQEICKFLSMMRNLK